MINIIHFLRVEQELYKIKVNFTYLVLVQVQLYFGNIYVKIQLKIRFLENILDYTKISANIAQNIKWFVA